MKPCPNCFRSTIPAIFPGGGCPDFLVCRFCGWNLAPVETPKEELA